ncbi:MAG: hypothetical protein ACRC68_05875 [Clostridium sp.]
MTEMYEVTHSPTDTAGVWKVWLASSVSAMFDHGGYVYADEAGMFSVALYPSEAAALEAMCVYAGYLNGPKEVYVE